MLGSICMSLRLSLFCYCAIAQETIVESKVKVYDYGLIWHKNDNGNWTKTLHFSTLASLFIALWTHSSIVCKIILAALRLKVIEGKFYSMRPKKSLTIFGLIDKIIFIYS